MPLGVCGFTFSGQKGWIYGLADLFHSSFGPGFLDFLWDLMEINSLQFKLSMDQSAESTKSAWVSLASTCLAFSLLLSPSAMADTIFGVYAGGGSWLADHNGGAQSGTVELDLDDDLGLNTDSNFFAYVAVEHPVPFLPNIRVQHTDIAQSATNDLTRTVEFNGQSFSANSAISSELDLEITDAVLYYELLDNVVSLDLGLAARYVDGFVDITSLTDSANAEFEGVLPMLYTHARVDLPFTGSWISARAQGLTYRGESFIDAEAQIGWESKFGLGLEVGYRVLRLDIDELDELDEAEINLSGPFAALNYHF